MSELGVTDKHYHKIDTGDSPPVCFYRHTPKISEEISRHVADLLKNGVIQPSTSEWQSPIVSVKKNQ